MIVCEGVLILGEGEVTWDDTKHFWVQRCADLHNLIEVVLMS